MITSIAFDLGGVLFNFDFNAALDSIACRDESMRRRIFEDIFVNGFTLDYEKGTISTGAFYERFCRRYDISCDFEQFVRAWSGIFSPNTEVIGLLFRLKRQYPLYLISNICESHYSYLSVRYPETFSAFEALILSYKVGSVKPEERIYEILKKTAGTEYKNILYIDDRQDLIRSSLELGIDSLCFRGYSDLIKELAARNISC